MVGPFYRVGGDSLTAGSGEQNPTILQRPRRKRQRAPGTGWAGYHERTDRLIAGRFHCEETMTTTRTAGLIVRFMDGSKIAVRYPKQAGEDPTTIAANVRKALDADRLLLEVDGNLLFIPLSNVKYVQVTPAPDLLPSTVLRHARMVD
jgi:hypothetical protein